VSCVLCGVPGLALLSGILDVGAALLGLMGIASFRITGALVTLIVGRDGWRLCHCLTPLLLTAKTTHGEHEGFFNFAKSAAVLNPTGSKGTVPPIENTVLSREKSR
jgi:hypothetical protein